MIPKCVVLGGGGHAKVVLEAILLEGRYRPVAVTDPDRSRRSVLGIPVAGGDEVLGDLRKRGVRFFVVGVGAVPNTEPRATLFRRAEKLGFEPLTAIHPSAAVSRHAIVGGGTVVLAQTAISPDARVGKNVIVNTGAIVEHDSTIGDHVHLCPGSRVSGGVHIGTGVFVGAGAILREGVRLGAGCVIGAGAVVLKDVSPGTTVVGVPARILRRKGTSR